MGLIPAISKGKGSSHTSLNSQVIYEISNNYKLYSYRIE